MEFSKIVVSYLKSCKLRINTAFIRKRLKSHPNYPSLISLTDTLTELGIEYKAVLADKDRITELQYPLLAHVENGCSSIFIEVKSVSEFQNDEELFMKWDGVAVYVNPTSSIQNQDHKDALTIKSKNSFLLTSLITSIAFIILYASYAYLDKQGIVIVGTSLLGLLLGVISFQASSGSDNTIIARICKASEQIDCKQVLNSKGAKLPFGYTLSDICISYFSCIILSTLFLRIVNNSGNYTTIFIIPFSLAFITSLLLISYQTFIIKKFCTVCLFISTTLVSQYIYQILTVDYSGLQSINMTPFLVLFCSFILAFSAWGLIKRQLKDSKKLLDNEIQLLKWRRDPYVFLSMLEYEKPLANKILKNRIVIGDPKADIRLSIICNPFCEPCRENHKYLNDLFHSNLENFFTDVYFVVFDHTKDNDHNRAISAIINAIKITNNAPLVLHDWFEIYNYDQFIQKYNIDKNHPLETEILKEFEEWRILNEFEHTPDYYINRRRLSSRYYLSELKLLIPHLSEILSTHSVVYNAE